MGLVIVIEPHGTYAIYEQIVTKQPYPLDFLWFANSNFVNMSPDVNRISASA